MSALATLRSLMEKATPGPWRAWAGAGWPREWAEFTGIGDAAVVWPIRAGSKTQDDEPIGVFLRHEDQAFVVALVNAAPALLARIEELEAALRGVLDVCRDRQAFVMQGPRAFARAEQIAASALATTKEGA